MTATRRRVSLLDGLVIALLAATVGSLLAMQSGAGTGQAAVVHVDGEPVLHLDLSRDGEYRVSGPLGESRIEVADGRVRVAAAPCRRRVCLRRGWLDSPGESATCLPNHLHLSVEGPGQRYDSLNH